MKRICCGIADMLKAHNADRQYVFVFNSQVARESWALWCVREMSPMVRYSPPTADHLPTIVDMQRFIAWDEFTALCASGAAVSGQAADSTTRRMFASDLIAKNAKSPFLESVVPKEYAQDAEYLAPSIARRLPALNMWKSLRESSACENVLSTPEMRDWAKIYDRYAAFMAQNNLFETSWQDPALDAANEYVLFYPTILEDWVQYESALSGYDFVTVVDLPHDEAARRPQAHLYPNARMELRKTALQIRSWLSSGEDAASIALTVPDIAMLRPYVERELRLYSIPFVTRVASPLSSTGIGRMFSAIYSCYTADFSLSAVRTLLQSCSVPWRDYEANGTIIDWATELVRLGSQMRCLCHYTESAHHQPWFDTPPMAATHQPHNIDPWQEVLRDPNMERERVWYHTLKDAVTSLVTATSFEQMRQVWFIKWHDKTYGLLNSDTFDADSVKYDKNADAILSRCITALYKLERLERKLDGTVKVVDHYTFFLEELKATLYSPQTDEMGVNVFDYKVSSCAAYKHNILINASQALVTVSYKALDFLPQSTRDALLADSGMSEVIDVSKEYLSLYDMREDSHISCSSNGFSGFGTPHSYLGIVRKTDGSCDTQDELDKGDFVTQERGYFVHMKCPPIVSDRQVNEVTAWASRLVTETPLARQDDGSVSEVPSYIEAANVSLRGAVYGALGAADGMFSTDSPMKISPTAMNNFFPCARKWLFKSALRLSDEETFDTDLMPDYSTGNILHKILEIFCRGYMERNKVLPTAAPDGTFGAAESSVRTEVSNATQEAAQKVYDNFHSLLSMPLVSRAFSLQRTGYVNRIMDFLHQVCKDDEIKKGAVAKYFLGGKYVVCVEEEKTVPVQQDCSIAHSSSHGEQSPSGLMTLAESTAAEDTAAASLSVMLHGKIDCVLETESGEHIIIDYKSGTMPSIKASTLDMSQSDAGQIVDFQMPVYVLLMNGDAEQACFFHIGDGKNNMVVSPGLHPISEYEPTVSRVAEYAMHFAKRAAEADFAPKDKDTSFAAFNVWQHCTRCPFKAICRNTYN